ncbi:hypothetical protein K227x_03190 [Rubripirellula lacrimiformis]|uniref:Uncharacterized protein n=1 Tax=Rubripirellula lacrimiformis TaxID=1930273 RepID=A0A517N483_9BACT|nr:hypothetical protein K227x_03190 [Rubripirellula lacrimiformis]
MRGKPVMDSQDEIATKPKRTHWINGWTVAQVGFAFCFSSVVLAADPEPPSLAPQRLCCFMLIKTCRTVSSDLGKRKGRPTENGNPSRKQIECGAGRVTAGNRLTDSIVKPRQLPL